ncbi:MAG: hypothetical protein V2B18_01165 [Pseudomonadota bacterium]
MKKKSKDGNTDDLRPRYDLSTMLPSGVQGKYARRSKECSNVVLLDSDVAAVFHTDEDVNEALRLVIQLKKLPRTESKGASGIHD